MGSGGRERSPSGERLFAVGDLHGCADELEQLLETIDPRSGDEIVFVGDYVDRGTRARDTIDRLIKLRDGSGARCVFLRGNHEDMFLSWLGESGRHGDAFLLNGGRATLESYGIPASASPGEARERIPGAHLEFLRELRLHHLSPPFLFVHAGIGPLVPLEEQDEEDLLWIREPFLRNRHRLPYTVIFGHTPHREIFWHLPWKIGIDTGCVYGNKLSCLELRSETLLEVRKGGGVTQRSVAEELRPLSALKGAGERV